MIQDLRKSVPSGMTAVGRKAAVSLGVATAGARMLPTFLMIGAQRCGTTSLFRALMAHPQVLRPSVHKGVNYFDINYHRGEDWYRGHFPVREMAEWRTRRHGPPSVFDASGYYMFHPLAPARIARDLPDIRLIALLRNPVERAYSAFKHESARGFEWLDFEEALHLEEERLEGEVDRMIEDPSYQSFNYRHHGYLARGRYVEQLRHLLKVVGPEQLLVVESECFFADPVNEYRRVTSFLGVQDVQPSTFPQYNSRPSSAMSQKTREWLTAYFEPHDRSLGELLGREPVWRR